MKSLRRTRGFTLFELVIVISIIAILGAVLAGRVQKYAELAEKTSMEYTVSSLDTALLFEFAGRIMRGSQADVPAMTQLNPMEMLAQKPANYLGEFNGAPPGADPSGNWYYDKTDHVLVYLVRRADEFHPDSAGLNRVRYRVKLLYDTVAPNPLIGVVLSPVEPYAWGGAV